LKTKKERLVIINYQSLFLIENPIIKPIPSLRH
jgi:hypothetical protein